MGVELGKEKEVSVTELEKRKKPQSTSFSLEIEGTWRQTAARSRTQRQGENHVKTNTTEATILQDVCSGPDHTQSSPSTLVGMPHVVGPWPQPKQEETDFRERN